MCMHLITFCISCAFCSNYCIFHSCMCGNCELSDIMVHFLYATSQCLIYITKIIINFQLFFFLSFIFLSTSATHWQRTKIIRILFFVWSSNRIDFNFIAFQKRKHQAEKKTSHIAIKKKKISSKWAKNSVTIPLVIYWLKRCKNSIKTDH